MNRVLIWSLVGALLGGGLAALIAAYDEAEGQMVIAGALPLTEDQVRSQLTARGWADLTLRHDERYIEVTGQASGREAYMMVDSLTGKIVSDDSDQDETSSALTGPRVSDRRLISGTSSPVFRVPAPGGVRRLPLLPAASRGSG